DLADDILDALDNVIYLQHRHSGKTARKLVQGHLVAGPEMETGNPGSRHVGQAAAWGKGDVEVRLHAVPLHGTNTDDRLGDLFRAYGKGQPVAKFQPQPLRQLGFHRDPLGYARSKPLPFHNPVVFGQVFHPGQVQLPVKRVDSLILTDRFFHRLVVQFGQTATDHAVDGVQGRSLLRSEERR